jgi:antitoxin MazE
MRVPVRKWGNSLALRIPKSAAEDSRIKQGSVVEVSVVRGRLVVSPVSMPKYNLRQVW